MKLSRILKRIPLSRRTAGPDAVAGLVLGVESVPDALASGVLAGVNPLNALYAVMLGTPVGAIFSGSAFLSVQTTSAMALVVASVPAIATGTSGTLFTLTLITGAIMLIAGLLKLGKLMRFVPNSEMVGFMQGVGVLVILGQLGDFTGYSSEYANRVARAVDLLFNLDQVDLPTVAVGITTVLLILVLQKTRLRGLGMVVAIIVASILPSLFGWDTVPRVEDIATITKGLPRPALPDLTGFATLIVPALSLTIIGLIQGAAVSQSFVNPDGSYPDMSRDFVGQGAANLAAGVFQGMPIGGLGVGHGAGGGHRCQDPDGEHLRGHHHRHSHPALFGGGGQAGHARAGRAAHSGGLRDPQTGQGEGGVAHRADPEDGDGGHLRAGAHRSPCSTRCSWVSDSR